VHAGRDRLLVTNRGPRELGYHYCTQCGRIDAAASKAHPTLTEHPKPYPDDRQPACQGSGTATGIVLGTDFITDVLLLSLRVSAPALLRPDVLATQVSLRTICEALVQAATLQLGLEPGELEANSRAALTPEGRAGLEAEIYLYDTLPGGAGFSRRVGAIGLSVIQSALDALENCPAQCDGSCYRCLRSFRNRLDHGLLDRQLGASLLRHLIDGQPHSLLASRIERSYDILAEDLSRNASGGFQVAREALVSISGLGTLCVPVLITSAAGRRTVIDLHHPLTPNVPFRASVAEIAELALSTPTLLMDELVVRRNLPNATARILEWCQ
jgi:hypothetical protein